MPRWINVHKKYSKVPYSEFNKHLKCILSSELIIDCMLNEFLEI